VSLSRPRIQVRRVFRRLGWAAGILAIAFAVLWLGTLVHEGGHALVALACGARVEEMNVLGLNVYPALRVRYRPGFYGYVRLDRLLPHPQVEYMRMAGSLGTLAVALLAQAILWAAPPRRAWPRLVVIGFCFSWIDIVYHTLPVLVGSRSTISAEAYSALVAVGASDWMVGMAVIGVSGLLLTLTLVRWRRLANSTSRCTA